MFYIILVGVKKKMTMKKILVFKKAVEIVLNRCVLKRTCSITDA